MLSNPNIKLPSVPNHTGSPALAVAVFNPASKPSVTTFEKPLADTVVSKRPNVLLEVPSVALDALLTIILVPSADDTYTACPLVIATAALTTCFN